MKKVFIALLFSFLLFSCQTYDSDVFTMPTTLNVSAVSTAITKFHEKYSLLSEDKDSCPTVSGEVVVINQGDDDLSTATYQLSREDLISVYQSEEFTFGGFNPELCTLVPYLAKVDKILAAYNMKLDHNNESILNLSYHEDIEGVGDITYQLFVDPLTYATNLRITEDNLITNIDFSFDLEETLLFKLMQLDSLNSELNYYISYEENRSFIDETINEEGISAREFNLITGEVILYQNQDGESYAYYNQSLNLYLCENESTKMITYYGDHGPYFYYGIMNDYNALISWQLLETSGWDHILIESTNYRDSVLGIYQGENLIIDAKIYSIENSYDLFHHSASVALVMWVMLEEVDNDLLSLNDFSLQTDYPTITLEKITADFETMENNYLTYPTHFFERIVDFKIVWYTDVQNTD